MEQKFNSKTNGLDLQQLREFCEREGEELLYGKGKQMERQGEPARWFAYVVEGCFKYDTRGGEGLRVGERSAGVDKEHTTWFSFQGEFVADYPRLLYGHPAKSTIEAMVPSRVLRVSGEQLMRFFGQSIETMELRAIIGEHVLCQFHERYLDLHCATPRERYDLLMQRCPGIVEHLPLYAIASFLNITPQMLSKIRKEITFNT